MSKEPWRKPHHSFQAGQVVVDKDGFHGEIVFSNQFMTTVRVRWKEGPMSGGQCKPYVVGVHEIKPA